MNYVIMTNGKNGKILFLVDRSKIKKRWWSYDWSEAIQFHKLSAAEIQKSKLSFNDPEIITVEQAIKFSADNELYHEYDDHPFSSEAF